MNHKTCESKVHKLAVVIVAVILAFTVSVFSIQATTQVTTESSSSELTQHKDKQDSTKIVGDPTQPLAIPIFKDGQLIGNDTIQAYQSLFKGPEYPGGVNGLMKYMMKAVKYPKEAQKADIQGRVIVKFIIAKDGSILYPTVTQSVSKELDEEALRVVNGMSAWQPAEYDGNPIDSYSVLPVTFKINDKKKKSK